VVDHDTGSSQLLSIIIEPAAHRCRLALCWVTTRLRVAYVELNNVVRVDMGGPDTYDASAKQDLY
jgi:hypothetical protein